MTVIVTRDLAARFRGFLASCMLEIGPGVYTAPRMNAAVRERVWSVLCEWFGELGGGSILMTWRDPQSPGGQQVSALGYPNYEMYQHDGIYLARKRGITEPEGV
jgi:CRISPR-associated protein Cas2